MNTLRVAVIGIGFLGVQHIEAIRRLPNTQVVAIVGRNLGKTQRQAKELGIERAFDSVEAMLTSDIEVDVIHNCTPNNLHYSINKQIIEAGIHLYAEKPFTLDADESAELVKLIKEKNVKCGINFNYRQNIIVAEMRERVKKALIGHPWFVHVEYLQDWLLYETDYDWRMNPEVGGPSRAIADIGSHCFDTIQYILDERIIQVEVKMLQKFAERKDGDQTRQIKNEDGATILVTFESGLMGLIRVSQVTAGKKNDFHISIEGDNQTLEWYQERPDRLWIGNRDIGNSEIYASEQYLTDYAGKLTILPNGHSVGWHDAVTQGIRNFYRGIVEDDEEGYVTVDEAHYVMKLIDACLISAKESKPVKINTH